MAQYECTTMVLAQGSYLLVAALAEGQKAFIVTARDMTEGEKKTFRRKAR